MSTSLKLPPESLKLTVSLANCFPPQTPTKPRSILGQPRAQSALEFGVAMQSPGYNIFVMGDPGLGRLSMITGHLDSLAETLPTPCSYAYVENFTNSREPRTIKLPAGQGQEFSKDIEKLIDNLLATFPAVFESPTYQQRKTSIERQFNQAYNNAVDVVENEALALNIALFREGEAISFVPVHDNNVLSEEQFARLAQTDKELFNKHSEILEDLLSDALLELPQWRRLMAERVKQLDTETISLAIIPLFEELQEKYKTIEDVLGYLDEIKKSLDNIIAEFLMPVKTLELRDNVSKRLTLIEQYLPTIIVDHNPGSGAPVIHEPHPTYQNLFGRIEYLSDQGTLITSYRRICAGSLHKANGGYIIIDAEKLLSHPFVWEALKRALHAGCLEIESPFSDLGINTISLKPELIPLNVKVILLGSDDVFYFLEEMDNEFNEIFKVLADFDSTIVRNEETMQDFARLMIKQAEDIKTKPLTSTAIEALIEHSCRLSENQHQFSARIHDSLEIIAEANLFCNNSHESHCDRRHIELALEQREYRNGRISQNILDDMLDGTILIDTDGEAMGKINGLTVLEIGGSSFGAPARITTTVYPGSRGIVDIEREAELGQAIHSKGVMILTGYLGHCYAQQFPLAISASIAIEQSYGYIDGDSASLAELCCLVSALTRTPIKQSFAITGSINQYGEVQAIGSVNQKIEGYFRLCKARGLHGQHAVIIPAANVRNLMLKKEVIDAVSEGLFAVYAVATVDETLELLTGQPVGKLSDFGGFPENSINFKAISRLREISEMAGDDKEEGSS
jgi:predicted ATP-dependent protease